MTRPTPVIEPRPGEQWRTADAATTVVLRDLPEEAAVGVAYDGRPHAVLMATPADVEDLAVGFTLTEGVVDIAGIADVVVEARDEGLFANVVLTPDGRSRRIKARARSLEGRSSCGLCGVRKLSDAMRPMATVAAGAPLRRGAIQAALAALEQAQELGRLTRAMHAAAFADADGALALVREDVGRHNALDKLIGAGARAGLDPAAAFVVVTSRCSYEMVEKAAAAGFPMLVAISAPTALAIRKAEGSGMTLVALARADGHTVFTHPERVAP